MRSVKSDGPFFYINYIFLFTDIGLFAKNTSKFA